MSDTDSRSVQICKAWYAAFDARNIDRLMSIFVKDPSVTVGAGNSHGAVIYSGSFVGEHQVREFYAKRFDAHTATAETGTGPAETAQPDAEAGGTSRSIPIREECAIVRPPCEYPPWVVFSGNIKDKLRVGGRTYDGPFLHVFTVDEAEGKIAALEMFLEPSKRLSAVASGQGTGGEAPSQP